MDWKLNIFRQLKDHKRESNLYDEIIEHYNRLLENNTLLHSQCIKFEKDVQHLRLANAGLEKASKASQGLSNVNNKLSEVNEEVVMHLREKGELAREVLRLNHALKEVNEKLINQDILLEKYKTENDSLTKTLEKSECDVNELMQINEVRREEFLAVQIQMDQLKTDYTRIKPTLLELQQQLDIEKRLNKLLEDQLIESKKIQLEMLDAEVKRYDKQIQPHKLSNTSEDDRVSVSSDRHRSDSICSAANGNDATQNYSDESSTREKRPSTSASGGGNIFTKFRGLFGQGMTNYTTDSFNRTSAYCLSASIPAREVNHWDCTELEVYALQFQPSGSILATGCSDKMVHLWEISQFGRSRKYCSLVGSHGAINAIDFDNEGARLLAGCSGDKAYLWSYSSQMLKDTYTGHSDRIYTCKFISGTKLVTGSADRYIKVWDLHGRQCIRTIPAGSKCHDLVITDAAGTIISGHFNKKIRIWDTFSDNFRAELQLNASITSLSYNAEKNQLLACLKDDTLKLIDLRQNNIIYSFSHDNFQVSSDTTKAILSPDGRYACVGSQDGSLFVWNTINGDCEKVLNKKHTTMVTSVAWHPDGRYVASCEKHRQVIIWSD